MAYPTAVLLLLQDPLDYKYYKSCVHCHDIDSSTYLPFNWNIVMVNLVNQNRKNQPLVIALKTGRGIYQLERLMDASVRRIFDLF